MSIQNVKQIKHVLQIRAAFSLHIGATFYYKLGQLFHYKLGQVVITKWGRYYKMGQSLLQMGQVLQIGASYYKLGHNKNTTTKKMS